MNLRRLYEAYAPRTRAGRLLAGTAAVDSMGSGLFLALIPVFVVTHVGIDPVEVGVALGLANLLGLLAPIPAGWLADRYGAGRVWSVLLLTRAIGYAGFLFVDSFAAYVVLTCVVSLLDRGSTPVQQVFVVQVEQVDERSRSIAVLRTMRNAGMSIGLLVSGVVIAMNTVTAYHLGFAVNALSYLGLLLAVRSLAQDAKPVLKQRPPTTLPTADARYLLVSVGNALLTLHDSVLFTLIPLWLVTKSAAPPALVGPLLALNTVLTVVLQVPLTKWSIGIAAATRTVIRAALPLVTACLLFLAAEQTGPTLAACFAAAAVIALTIGENLHTVAGFELSHRLAPEHSAGAYLGVFNLGIAAQLCFGPPFMTAVVLRGPVGWLALAATFAVGTGLMVVGSRRRDLVRS